MKQLLRMLALLLVWTTLGLVDARAQLRSLPPGSARTSTKDVFIPGNKPSLNPSVANRIQARTCADVNEFNFDDRNVGEDWKTSRTLTTEGTTLTSGYASNVTAAQSALTVQDLIYGRVLSWNVDFTANGTTAPTNAGANNVQLTLTLNRLTTGFSVTINDIDRRVGTQNDDGWTDLVQFDGYTTTTGGTPITLTAADVTLGTNNSNAWNGGNIANTVIGTGNNTTTDGNVTVLFPSAVRRVVITYKNAQTTYANPGSQIIGIAASNYCAQADVYTTLTAPASLSAGITSGNYTATFGNNGVDYSQGTTRVVTIPGNRASAVTSAQGTVSGSQAAGWTITYPSATSVAPGGANAVSYTFTLVPVATASIAVTSTTGTTTDQSTTANNTSNDAVTVTTNVTAVADLTTTLTGPGSLGAGVASGNYTVTYTNNGPSVATSTTRTVTIPNTYVSGVSAPSGSVANTGGNFVITFPAGSNVAAGGAISYNFTITPTTTTSIGQNITATSNTAPGTGGTGQGGNAAADAASLGYVVGTVADVGVSFTGGQADNSTVTAGATVNYTVNFNNAGPGAGTAVTRTVSIPAGVPSVTQTGGTLTGDAATGWTITYPGGAIPLNVAGTAYSFSYVAPATGPVAITANTTTSSGQAADTNPNSATRTLNVNAVALSGTVYDDVNYGGGAGRPFATANSSATASGFANGAIGRANATVEIYTGAGAFVGTTTTDATGAYSYNLPAAGSYTVRVVNASVTPARAFATGANVVPVQTYVLTNNSAAGNLNRVGGENPQFTDAAANTGTQTLGSLTSGTVTPQSVYTTTFNAGSTTGVDFGFNFDTVVNTNDVATVTGTNAQGSLRQFIINANSIANTNLDQAAASTGGANPAAGVETSIFMISNGTAVAGLRAGLTNQLSAAGVAIITPAVALPALTGANSAFTSIDGTTQTQNVGNTNNTTLGTGGTVGTNNTALAQLNGPEVQLIGSTAIAFGFDVAATATNTTIKGLAVLDFGNSRDNNAGANIRSAANNLLITQNVLGTTATSFTAPATLTNSDNVRLTGGTTGITVSNNLIGYSNSKGISINSGVVGVAVTGNEIRANGQGGANFDGIDIQGRNATVTNNLLTGTSGQGVDSYRSTGGNTISNNTITDNGRGTTAIAPNETPGVRIYGAGNTVSQNIISDNYGAGIMLEGLTNNGATAAVTTTVITQNSIFNNGNVLGRNGAAATGQVGIDLESNGDNESAGTSPFQTLNSATTTGANGLLNYPVITSAVVSGTNLIVSGYAKAGAVIELFTAQANPAAVNATGANFGQGQTYLTTLTEGSGADTDTRTGLSYSGNINGFNQGADTNANGFTFTIPLNGLALNTLLTATARLGGATSEFSGNAQVTQPLTGYVYDDVNYGGGAGRTFAAANTSATGSGLTSGAIGRAGATVELYNASGAFVASTTTAANGQYSFNVTTGNYTVRVVNSTVTPARASSATGLLPVQTYVYNDVNRVGGEDPTKTDAAANTTSATLASLTSGTGTAAVTPESIVSVTVTSAVPPSIDFGFNFDAVVNTRDAGQGSLRQFILNANALSNTGLDQDAASTGGANPAAGVETSIFMISNGTAVAGLRGGLTNQLSSNGVAVIAPASALPAIAGANSASTSIDGTTQTQNVGNTNATTLGAGGTVGTGNTALGTVGGPEVQLTGTSAIAIGLDVASTGTGSIISGLAVYGFGNTLDNTDNAEIRIAANNVQVNKSVIGTSAISFTDPGAATRSNADAIRVTGGTGTSVTNNLIGFNNGKGIATNGTAAITVTNNEIRSNALGSSALDGIDIQGNNTTVTNNLVVNNAGVGVDGYNTTGGNTITGNTVTGNGRGTAANGPNETPGVRIYGTNNAVTQNIVNGNYGAGVMLAPGATTTRISQNSIFNNGTVAAANGTAATGEIGIDLLGNGEAEANGASPFVTLNSATATGANSLLNYPVLTSATLVGTNLVLKGYAKAGAAIELFIAQANAVGSPANGNNFGQGQTYLTTLTEGSGADTDTRTGLSYSGNINGFNQGADTNANGFTFTIPLSTAQQALVISGIKLTATSTLANATSEFSGNIGLSTDVTTTIAGPNTLAAGQVSGTFTATFSNAGNASASAVAQTVTLPAGASLTTAQLNTIQAAYPGTNYSGGTGGTLTFPQAATLLPGASNVYQFVFTAPTAAGTPSIVSNVSTATTQNPNTAPDQATFNLTVVGVADVAATITGSASPVPAGSTGSFTATFTNNGPSTAAGVQATVQLTPAVTNVTINGNGPTGTSGNLATYAGGVTYNTATGLLSTPATPLTNGQTFNATIGYTQPSQGNVTATAAISTTTSQGALSSNGNPSTANDTQTATNAGSSGFDLATSLSGPSSAVAGSQVTYAVTTINNGPGVTPGAVQTVSLVTTNALTNVFVTNGGTYSFSNGTSLFTFPTIPSLGSGQQVNNSISFTSPGPAAGGLSLTALATPSTSAAGDMDTNNNQTSMLTFLSAAPAAAGNTANLYVGITSNAPTGGVAPGASVVLTVTQGNNGPNTATDVLTQVYLPAGLTGMQLNGTNPNSTSGGISTYASGETYNANTGVFTLLTNPNQTSNSTPQTHVIVFNAPASGVITATASVSAGTNDPVPADNVALTSVTVNQAAIGDVTTTLNGPSTATPGESIVYTVSAINNGTTAATGVGQTVQLPAGLTGVVVRDANNNVIANSTTTGYNDLTGLVVFSPAATLASGASLTRTITLPAPSNAGSPTSGTIVPVASVTSSSFDNVLTNNSASVTTRIIPTSDFVVTLNGPTTTVVGNPVTFTVSTTNNGASVGGQQTTVQLPTGLDAAGGGLILPTGATYSGTTGILTLPAIAAQGLGTANAQTASVTFNTPTGTVLLTPTAQVAPATGTNDANLTNNAATVTMTVNPATETVINLATTVTSNAPGNTAGAGGTRVAGLPITFTVTASNLTAGTSATNVVQQLTLAAGLTGVVIDGTNPTATVNGVSTYTGGTTYNANTGVVNFPAITLGATASSHTVLVNAPGTGPLVATAAVKGDQTDIVPANNTASTSIGITQSADLITTTTGPTTTTPATPVSYSVTTTNNGASVALGVVPTMTLPAGATNVVLPTGASQAGNVVTFATVGNLAIGQSATSTVTFTTPAAATTSYTVSSTAATTTNEPVMTNNPSSLAVTNAPQTPVPVAFSVVSKTVYSAANGTVNSPSANTAGQNFISPLAAAASTGLSISSYTVQTVPTTAQGTLYYNNNLDGVSGTFVALAAGQGLSAAQAAKLKFDPADNATTTASVGDISFTYTATDNQSKVSNTAIYTIPVGRDNNSVYTSTPNKGGANQYQTNDVLAFVIDPNGAVYNNSGLVYNPSGTTTNILATNGNNGLVNQANSVVQSPSGSGPAASGQYPANPTNVLPAGVSLNTTTGLIYVSNRALLVNYNTVKYYQINVTTTDIYGGTNVVTAQFSIGAYPLPVELTDFTAQAVKNVDAALVWHTATEKNNDHFDVERSFNGTDFVKFGQVAGQGSKATPTAYALTDAGIGAKATTVYYRLKQVDADGTSSYSPVRTVSFTKAVTPSISLFPNPATSATQLDLSQLPAGSYQVSMLDATGRVVLNATHEAGLSYGLELNTIASGTYVVLVRGNNGGQVINLTKRLIKE